MLDRLISEGGLGETYGEIVRSGFLHFCREHPELLRPTDDAEA
jgi:hypothetical protein